MGRRDTMSTKEESDAVDLTNYILQGLYGRTRGSCMIALTAMLAHSLKDWPIDTRSEMLSRVVQDLKSAVLKHNV